MEYDWSEIDLSQIWIELYRVCGRILKDWVLVSHKMATAGKQFMEKCNSPSFKENNYTFKPYELVLEIESSCWIKMKQVVQRFVLFWFNLSVNVSLQLVDEVCDDVHVA